MCGDITTICLLLGVAPRPLLSAFTSHSNVHELLFNPGTNASPGVAQTREMHCLW
jgi:hypothetical protein